MPSLTVYLTLWAVNQRQCYTHVLIANAPGAQFAVIVYDDKLEQGGATWGIRLTCSSYAGNLARGVGNNEVGAWRRAEASSQHFNRIRNAAPRSMTVVVVYTGNKWRTAAEL